MIINMTSNGGVGLNFKVVQYATTPTGTAAENTIGVVTDTAITGWVMSAEQPVGVEGMVWILLGTSSTAAFNADKKNVLNVYPLLASQYVGGEWITVPAVSYLDGAWVEWLMYLYKEGDECTTVTGGWEEAYASGPYYNKKGTFVKNDTNITITASTTRSVIFAKTVNKIDVSDMKTLTIKVSALTNTAEFGLNDGSDWNDIPSFVSRTKINAVGITSLDVSNVTGEYYVACMVANDGTTRALSFTEVRLS